MRVAFEPAKAHRVERSHNARSRQVFHRGFADAVRARFVGDLAVAPEHRVAGIEDDFSVKLLRVIFADLRIGAVGDGDKNDVAEVQSFAHRADTRQATKTLSQRFDFLGMARGEHHLIAGLYPKRADGTADVAGADDADLWLRIATGRLAKTSLR